MNGPTAPDGVYEEEKQREKVGIGKYNLERLLLEHLANGN